MSFAIAPLSSTPLTFGTATGAQSGIHYIFPHTSGALASGSFAEDGISLNGGNAFILNQDQDCHYTMTDQNHTSSTLGVSSVFSANENVSFSVDNTDRYANIYVGCGGDGGTTEITLGTGFAFGTIASSPDKYTISESSGTLTVTSGSGGEVPSEPLYILFDAGSGNNLQNLDINFNFPAANAKISIQAIASGNDVPEACFGEETMVETETGSQKISSLTSGTRVKVRNAKGEDVWVKANVLNIMSIKPSKNRCIIRRGSLSENFPTQDLVISKDHLILVPERIRESLLKPVSERYKAACYAHDTDVCNVCAPFPIPPGFAPILVRDIDDRFVVYEPSVFTNWWHLTLPFGDYPDGGAVVLSSGVLAETHRTPSDILVREQGWTLK